MRLMRGFARFWVDLIIGDDWRIAAGVVTVLTVTTVAGLTGTLSGPILTTAGAAALVACFTATVVLGIRRR